MTTEGDTMNIPQGLPTLHAGAHKPGDGKACIMEYVALLAGGTPAVHGDCPRCETTGTVPTALGDLAECPECAGFGFVEVVPAAPAVWTDTPACTHRVLALVAQSVNDELSDADRHLLVPLIGRLFGTGIGDRAESLRVTVGLAVWAKDHAAKSARSAARSAAKSAEVAARYAEYAAESAESAAKYAESAARYAEAAARYAEAAAKYAEYAAKYAESAAKYAEAAAESAASAAKRVGFLGDLIDEYDRLTGRTNHRVVTTPELTELAQLVTT